MKPPFFSYFGRGFVLAFLLLAFSSTLQAQQPSRNDVQSVATKWPGIRFQVFHLERIPGNRLLVGIKVEATASSPSSGTIIDTPAVIPSNATAEEIAEGLFMPTPFSFASAILTDELTGHTFSTLSPDPAGQRYLPSTLLANLHPGDFKVVTLQFPFPPPPPEPSDAGKDVKQTVSLLLPNAVGPVRGLALPESASPPHP